MIQGVARTEDDDLRPLTFVLAKLASCTNTMSVIAAPPDKLDFDKGALEEEGKEQYLRTLG